MPTHKLTARQEAEGKPSCIYHPDRPVRANLDGDDLCQGCCDEWVRGEGAAEAEAQEAAGGRRC